jgi:hypothetical protein
MGNQPVQEIRLGHIRASIWANQTDEGIRHNITFTRMYKIGRRWQDTGSFGCHDLPVVSQVADLAHKWILQQA